MTRRHLECIGDPSKITDTPYGAPVSGRGCRHRACTRATSGKQLITISATGRKQLMRASTPKGVDPVVVIKLVYSAPIAAPAKPPPIFPAVLISFYTVLIRTVHHF